MLEISPQGPSGLPGKICLCGIGAAGTKVMEEVLLLSPQPWVITQPLHIYI